MERLYMIYGNRLDCATLLRALITLELIVLDEEEEETTPSKSEEEE